MAATFYEAYFVVDNKNVNVETSGTPWDLRFGSVSSNFPAEYRIDSQGHVSLDDMEIADYANWGEQSRVEIARFANSAGNQITFVVGSSSDNAAFGTCTMGDGHTSMPLEEFVFNVNRGAASKLFPLSKQGGSVQLTPTWNGYLRLMGPGPSTVQNETFAFSVKIKKKTEGYSLSWPLYARITATQEMGYVSVTRNANITMSPYEFSGATYDYKVYKTVDGVQTYLGNMGSATTKAFPLSPGDYGKEVLISVVGTASWFDGKGYAETAEAKTYTFSAVEPTVGWSQGAELVFTSNYPDMYSIQKTYAVGDMVRYSGTYYRCITAINTPEQWHYSKWEQVDLTITANVALNGDAVAVGGSGTMLYTLSLNGNVVPPADTASKTWTTVIANPGSANLFSLRAALTVHGTTYYSSVPLTFDPKLSSPSLAYYDGTKWVPCNVYRYDGQQWVLCNAYVYDGQKWVEGASL